MWLGLLGTLHVEHDDAVIRVPAAKQRVVLAALTMQPNRVVSFDELTDAVWGDKAPPAARATLRNYVKRLRQGLGPEMASRIKTHDPGYRIELDEAELDLAQFTRLCAAGAAAVQSGLWERGGTFLGEALDLWRGAPLSDVPSDTLRRSEVPRLEQLRLQAMEWRLEAQLHLGRHAEAVPQLQALITEFPLRERLHAYLMLALYRCGRQADALAAYHGVRRMLVDELGVEPGAELQHLHQLILAADGRLRWPGGTAATAAGGTMASGDVAGDGGAGGGGAGDGAGGLPQPGRAAIPAPLAATGARAQPVAVRTPPRQLPPAPRHFAGRTTELRQLTRTLDQQATTVGTVLISAVGGAAGVGKTALVLHWAHQVAARFPHGQLYADLQGFGPARAPLTSAEAVRGFLAALGVPHEAIPSGAPAQVGLYRSLLADRRVLIVLDNVRNAEQVRPLLPSSPRCLTVVTSRNRLTGLAASDGAALLTLDVLTETEARELLERRLGAQRLAAEPQAAAELIRLCARLPLALSIAAAHAATNPGLSLADLAAELAMARLDTLATQDAATDVRAVFSWSYRNLSPPAARMFALTGVHPGPDVTALAAASLAGVPLGEARAALAELAGAHLLAGRGSGRLGGHDLLREYAAERAEADVDGATRRAAVCRVLDHYLHTAHAADLCLDPQREPTELSPPAPGVSPEPITSHDQALAWFQAEQRVLLAAVALAARAGFGRHAWQLAWAQATYFKRHGDWHDWADVQRIALAAAQRADDLAGQARARFDLGRASLRLGTYAAARAQLRSALALFAALGDQAGQARSHLELGRTFRAQGDLARALDHAGQALTLAEAAGNRMLWAGALNNIGYYHAYQGQYEDALRRCHQALEVFRELGCRSGEAQTLDSVGYAYHRASQHDKAVDCYRQALDVLRELDSRCDQATLLTHLGDALATAGDQGPARDAWQQAVDILDELGHPDAGQVRSRLHSLG